MSKEVVKEVAKEEVVDGFEQTADAKQDAENFKAKKREAAKRFNEKQKAAKEERIESMKQFIEELKANGTWDKLSDNGKNLLNSIAFPVATNQNSGLFTAIFGANPEVGMAVKLSDIFTRTLKGKSAIDHYVKKWAEKGIVVAYKANPVNVLDSEYVIEKM